MLKSMAGWIRDRLPYGARRQLLRVGRFFTPPPTPRMSLKDVTFPSLEGTFICLKERGFSPTLAIDIGAYRGDWALLFREYFPQSGVIMVEAQEEKRQTLEELQKKNSQWLAYKIALLGPVTGQPVRFVEMDTGSSVYEEQSHYNRNVVEKTSVSLDDLLADDSRVADFIKLDVQGYELEVLRGASIRLSQAQVVLMEASLLPINQGAPLIAEVIQFMADRSFRLVDFCSQIRRKDGALWQTDLLFIRSGSAYLPVAQLTTENW